MLDSTAINVGVEFCHAISNVDQDKLLVEINQIAKAIRLLSGLPDQVRTVMGTRSEENNISESEARALRYLFEHGFRVFGESIPDVVAVVQVIDQSGIFRIIDAHGSDILSDFKRDRLPRADLEFLRRNRMAEDDIESMLTFLEKDGATSLKEMAQVGTAASIMSGTQQASETQCETMGEVIGRGSSQLVPPRRIFGSWLGKLGGALQVLAGAGGVALDTAAWTVSGAATLGLAAPLTAVPALTSIAAGTAVVGKGLVDVHKS